MTVTNISAELNALIEAAEDRRKELEKKESQEFDRVVGMLFEFIPKLKFFMIRGYTPGFNDGDPCVHRQATMATPKQFSWEGDEDDFDALIAEFIDEDVLEMLPKGTYGDTDYTPIFDQLPTAEEAGVVQKVFDKVFYNVVRKRFDTDFKLTFRRDDKSDTGFTMTHEEYDCGY